MVQFDADSGAGVEAVDMLRIARLKRQVSTHVFVIPKLLLPKWRKYIHKVADIVLECAVGQTYWPAEMHEPLLIGICFPFVSKTPWQLRGAPVFFSIERMLRGAWKNKERRATNLLKNFCKSAWRLSQVDEEYID